MGNHPFAELKPVSSQAARPYEEEDVVPASRNTIPERVAEALDHAARGWCVVPVRAADASGACTCPARCAKPGKHPHIKQWPTRATTERDQIEQWWGWWPDANIGIATGKRSGLIVLDVDPRHGGDDALDEIMTTFDLPKTLTARTGDGVHLYFQYPAGMLAKSLPALEPWAKRGIDVQSDGKFVVSPGSLHKSGRKYEWQDRSVPVAEFPEALIVGLGRDPEVRPDNIDPYLWSILIAETNKVRTAPPGQRNNALNRASFRLGRILDEGVRGHVEGQLYEAGRASGLGHAETEQTVRSGLRDGAEKPKTIDAPYASREDALRDLERMGALFRAQPRDGKPKSQSVQRTMEALLKVARKAGGPKNFGAGLKTLHIEGRLARGSVRNALLHLQVEGWLILVKEGSFTTMRSRVWSLQVPPDLDHHLDEARAVDTVPPTWSTTGQVRALSTVEPGESSISEVGEVLLDEAFRNWTPQRTQDWLDGAGNYHEFVPQGLGWTRARIYLHLTEAGVERRVGEIAESLSIHPGTVGRNMRKLIEYGLVKKTGHGRYRGLPATLERLAEIAEDLGVSGVDDDQRRRYGWKVAPDAKDLGPSGDEGPR